MKICFFSRQNFFASKGTGGYYLSSVWYETITSIWGRENVHTIMLCCTDGDYRIDTAKTDKLQLIDARNNTVVRNLNYMMCRNCLSRRQMSQVSMALKSIDADFYFFDGSWLGRFANEISKGKKIIVLYHNVEKQFAFSMIKSGRSLAYVPALVSNCYNEAIISKRADYRICLNDRDNQLIKKYYGNNGCEIIPIFVDDPGRQMQRIRKKDEVINLLFVGSYFKANIDGIIWFCKNVLPYTDCKLTIVGKGMESLRNELINDKVIIKGYVASLDDEYNRADGVVLPIFYGGGMKVKTAEAISYGKMIFATDEALVGYEDVTVKARCNSEQQYIEAIHHFSNSTCETYFEDNYNCFQKKYSKMAVLEKCKEIFEL